MTSLPDVHALVVGGGAAGLSAALVLGRARVRTLVVDAGEPSNRAASAVGGLLGQPDTSPADFYAAGRAQLSAHPAVTLRAGAVTEIASAGDDRFRATLADGEEASARRVLLAGGMKYVLPPIDGLAGMWGTDAFMCPYCHGWELRDRRIAVLGAEGLAHRVPLLRQWSEDLIVVAGGPLDDPTRESLGDAVSIDERPVQAVAPGVIRFTNGAELAVDAFHVVATLRPRDDLAAQIGLTTEDTGQGSGFVVADRWGQTSNSRVFAAGDRLHAGNVATAVAEGNLAATGLHRSLVFELQAGDQEG